MESRWKMLYVILTLAFFVVLIGVLQFPSKDLQIIACDVGQGDGTLIIHGKIQILVDGGPDSSVVGCLDEHLPFWDRELEMVIITHPQVDHFGGLVDVVKSYKVKYLLASEINSVTQEYQVLEDLVGGSDIKVIRPEDSMQVRLGLIHLDILHPSSAFINARSEAQDVDSVLGSRTTEEDLNDFSIVFQLSYKDFDALFTGDIGPEIIDLIVLTNKIHDVEYLKVPHHGSRNGLTQKLLDVLTPELAVISSGKNNPHGHPHKEVIKLLKDAGIKFFRTDEVGDVVISTDGEKVKVIR